MRKKLCGVVVGILLMLSLAGCGQEEAAIPFEADNEIITYQRIDPEKTQLIVSRTGNIPVEELCKAFEAENPDVQVIYLDITGGNYKCAPLEDWIKNGDLPDIVITGSNFTEEKVIEENFENLSDNPVLERFEAAALQRSAVDSNVYWLPGPSDINAMIYNETLFQQYGWEVPETFDEFVSLCAQITADTNGEVQPWNPNAKYDNELMVALEAITYEELFGGVENRSWYQELLAGEATFKGHMEPFFEMVQTLIDNDILTEEHFTYSATTRGQEFAEGKIAMINMNLYNADNEAYDFSLMPFPSTTGNIGYLCDRFSCFVGLPTGEHSEAEEDAINRFLIYFSSEEGQQAYIGDTLKISNSKGVDLNQNQELAPLQPAVDAGHLFEVLGFQSDDEEKGGVNLYQLVADMTAGKLTAAECVAEADKSMAAPAENTEVEAEPVATATEDLTILETSFLIADAYREIADADIGLITHNEAYRGNLMRIYAGDFTTDFVTVLKPRSFDNESTLLKASMTGQQLLDALNHPVGNEQVANCIYAYAGLKCEVAPWNELGSKYLSATLADGTALEPEKLYTVALWAGTVDDAYVTETLKTYTGTWEELMTAELKAVGEIAPAKDDRIKLVWE